MQGVLWRKIRESFLLPPFTHAGTNLFNFVIQSTGQKTLSLLSKDCFYELNLHYCCSASSPQRPRSLILDNLPISVLNSLGHLIGNGANGCISSPAGSDRRSPASQRSTPQTTFNTMMLVPEAEEIRVSPIVSRKGYLNILDQRTKVNSPPLRIKPHLITSDLPMINYVLLIANISLADP